MRAPHTKSHLLVPSAGPTDAVSYFPANGTRMSRQGSRLGPLRLAPFRIPISIPFELPSYPYPCPCPTTSFMSVTSLAQTRCSYRRAKAFTRQPTASNANLHRIVC
ncbi:Hypothetical protein NTJ_12483 [Nesidiocoris tenuis]|uniref:Uncharacterized protein n=1 Tax=Nesidiocoris tenuis TaxID=355587 RepID=A0ABN7B5H8_9HEMI|nr:Hypothetical protein NTJ_12483 [Nesidiocoris tenuis]